MASFDLFKTILAKNEGGYQNLVGDSGNYNSKGERVGTNFGISARFYESILKRPPTVADMKALTLDQANKIYKVHFWDDVQGDTLINQSVANIIADHAVNAGEFPIGKQVQIILRDKFKQTIKIDGDIGPATAKIINTVNQAELFEEIKNARLQLYLKIGGQFLGVWTSRVKSFLFTPGNAPQKKKLAQ